MMHSFTYQSLPSRVLFGAGMRRQVAQEAQHIGATRVLVVCTPEQVALAQQVADDLGRVCAGIFSGAVMHVPVEVANEAIAKAVSLGADAVVAIGGGSTTGLAKAIALKSELAVIAIPTTYAGSEMTPIYGLTEGGVKVTGRDARVLPKSVIYDAELTTSLPLQLSVTSGINAIAHAAEGLYAHDGNPITSLMARDGIRSMGRAIGELSKDPLSPDARADALYGAWLCGSVLGAVSMAIHHKLCHTLGGSFNLPHAQTHTIVLPHALAYNQTYAPQAMSLIAGALNASNAPQAVYELANLNGASVALRDIGMQAEDLDKACDLALQNQYPNPRPLEKKGLRALLQAAFEGVPPTEYE